MSATEEGGFDREGTAAEYALGTLDARERAEVALRLDLDPELAAAVARWEAYLAPLTLNVSDVDPPAHLWQALEMRLDGLGDAARTRLRIVDSPVRPADTAAAPSPAARSGAGGWRALALAASLAAFVLGGLYARDRLAGGVASGEPLVAVLQTDGKAPAFLVSVDVAKRELTVSRVGAAADPNHSHELWMVSDKVGKPVSLGVVGERAAAAPLQTFDVGTFEAATYAVSLEPVGGSPTGQPTGPVLFTGKLVQLPKALGR